MERHWIYVCDESAEWELRDHEGGLLVHGRRFADVEDAMRAAIQLARDDWRENGRPSGVRVQSRSGPWQDVTRFGETHPGPLGG